MAARKARPAEEHSLDRQSDRRRAIADRRHVRMSAESQHIKTQSYILHIRAI